MAKQPTIETLLVGYAERHKLNQNFEAIAEKFDEMLSRNTVTDTPNYMETDLDIADANITNTNLLEVTVLTIGATTFTALSDYYIYLLHQLDCDTPGSILTHDVNGDPECLMPGTNGQVLKVSGNTVVWAEDLDTDTDTVGVTVQEDGVTVAENVTTIDFIWTNVSFPNIVTTPSSEQVDIALDDVYTSTISALWEDTRSTDNANINPIGPSGSMWTPPSSATRVDLVAQGIPVPSSDNELYFIMEVSNNVQDSSGPPPAVGTWSRGIKFFDATGTSTPGTGVEIGEPLSETGLNNRQGNTDGGNLITIYCGVPAGTAYIDSFCADTALFPLFITYASIDNRYRAIVSAAAKAADFQSPNNISYPGAVNASVTPGP